VLRRSEGIRQRVVQKEKPWLGVGPKGGHRSDKETKPKSHTFL
jgi:hypothetical protein